MKRRNFLKTVAVVGIAISEIIVFCLKGDSSAALTSEEENLAEISRFDRTVLQQIKAVTQAKLEQLEGYDPGEGRFRKPIKLAGVSVAVSKEKLYSTVEELRTKLPPGYFIAVVNNYQESGLSLPSSIAILKTRDRYDLLRIRHTSAANYGLSTHDVIAKLKVWEQQSEFDIVEVASDSITLSFRSLPSSICAFAEEVYQFCPDSVEQGISLYYDPDDDAEVYQMSNRLCPQLSANYGQLKRERQKSEIQENIESLQINKDLNEADRQEQLTFFLSLLKELEDNQLDQEINNGIRLLAFEIHKTHQLNLWWD